MKNISIDSIFNADSKSDISFDLDSSFFDKERHTISQKRRKTVPRAQCD